MAFSKWSLVWLLGLIFIGWPVAGFFAGYYVLCLPFAVFFRPCQSLIRLLEALVRFPLYFAHGMKSGKRIINF